ncbi:SGNH hydrolase-type esterase domain-containing protein [Gongronella butleri]|nr:SGNH hydrolase-type esterase domain-containing protein [Gongronella butleri]
MRLSLSLGLVALSVVSCRVDARASRHGAIKRIIAFADSYTDNGNDFAASGVPGPPNWEGRFSNGPTWLDIVAQNTSVQVLNHGFGGATTDNAYVYSEFNNYIIPGLTQQIETIPVSSPDAASDLYVIYIGYNDLLGLVRPGNYHIVKDYTYETVADNVVRGIKTLQAKYNATQFAVLTCPPFDLLPAAPAANKAAAAHVINGYNRDLARKVRRIRGAHISVLDDHAWFEQQFADPARLGVQTDKGPCLSSAGLCDDPDTYFIWDDYHPTRVVHKALGEWAMRKFANLYGIH